MVSYIYIYTYIYDIYFVCICICVSNFNQCLEWKFVLVTNTSIAKIFRHWDSSNAISLLWDTRALGTLLAILLWQKVIAIYLDTVHNIYMNHVLFKNGMMDYIIVCVNIYNTNRYGQLYLPLCIHTILVYRLLLIIQIYSPQRHENLPYVSHQQYQFIFDHLDKMITVMHGQTSKYLSSNN